MQQKKTISISQEVLNAWLKCFPSGKKNFSKSIEGGMLAILNQPLIYWKSQAKYYQQRFQSALYILQALEAKKEENERAQNARAAREEVVFSRR